MSVYYIHDNGVSVGPFERDILLKFVASGRLNAASAVRREDGQRWKSTAEKLRGLDEKQLELADRFITWVSEQRL